jgi:hypothetical protein
MRGRSGLAERFMRPSMIVVAPKAIEPRLLLAVVRGGRCRGLGLERAVHPFVPAILLRLAALDALQGNPGLEPLHRQP